MTQDPENKPDKDRDTLRYSTPYHAPVLCDVVVKELVTDRSGVYVDATLGGGGHSSALLDRLDSGGRVIGIDQDMDAIEEASKRLSEAKNDGRFSAIHGSFSIIKELLNNSEIYQIHGLLLDLGVSSHQFDKKERGFSFQGTGMIDMRMDQRNHLSAYDIVNHWPPEELKRLFKQYGEEPAAARIARRIAEKRPLETTTALADVVRSTVPSRQADKTLARVFQALRIEVNQELQALEYALHASVDLLTPGGRIAVISYHSLEDRRVKRFLRYGNMEGKPVRDLYGNLITPWRLIHRHVIQPDEVEISQNPRARSARLRIAERTTHNTSQTAA
ncbi:MAG: 16S rRNA (cytosine(1402)-N(4))-methyltransferase RsmH [Rhodothermaceae bacterium]|nr:16S rRNA (cytosine(1402)-N(4))-methyltransferase RsmH [Rhodothermaceae bacterium]